MSRFKNQLSNKSSIANQLLTGASVAGVVGLVLSALFFSIEGVEEIESGGCSSCTTTITGTDNGSYSLSDGDVFCIASGATFSGSVQRNSGNGTVIICNEGSISGASLAFNKGDNYISNYGTMTGSNLAFNGGTKNNEFINYQGASATFSSVSFYKSGTSIFNHGELSSTSFTLSNGVEFINFSTGTFSSSSFTLNNQTDADNQGDMAFSGNVTVNSNAELQNMNALQISGNLTANGDFSSEGSLDIGGNLTVNGSGTAVLEGTSAIGGNLVVNHELEQDGTLDITGSFTVNGGGDVIILGDVSVAGDFTVNGNIEGPDPSGSDYGTIFILGQTTLNGGGDLGGNLDVCDQGEPEDGMDNFYGNADGSVTWCDNAAVSMPVEWLAFDASPGSEGVDLMWMTAVEENNDFFTVERSVDALVFEEVERISGSGTSEGPLTYQTTDRHAPAGRLYYRIRQTDFDGKSSFSNQVEVLFEQQQALQMSMYPNPASDRVTINIEAQEAASGLLQVLSVQGQVILSESVTITPGANSRTLALDRMASGTYLVQVKVPGSQALTGRLVKQ